MRDEGVPSCTTAQRYHMKAGKEEKELGYCTVFSAERQPSVSMGGNERKEEMKNGSKIASVKSVVFDMMELFL